MIKLCWFLELLSKMSPSLNNKFDQSLIPSVRDKDFESFFNQRATYAISLRYKANLGAT